MILTSLLSLSIRNLELVSNNSLQFLSLVSATLKQSHLAEKKVKFLVKPFWGMDMGSEHERYLAEKVY